jgi:hypothetical protein
MEDGMNRRELIRRLCGALAALPFVGKALAGPMTRTPEEKAAEAAETASSVIDPKDFTECRVYCGGHLVNIPEDCLLPWQRLPMVDTPEVRHP